jgi:hypothetical protein
MAFSGDGRKLTGSDGVVYKVTLGTEVTGNGSTNLPVGLHLITAVGGTTDWPTNSGATGAANVTAGRIVRVRTGDVITPTTTDKYKTLTLTQLCDITSFQMPFTAAEIDVTTFCDDIMTYEVGKVDMQGTLSGITTIGTTTDNGGFLNQFIDIVKQDGDTSIDVFESASSVLFGYFVINKNSNKGDELAIFAPINIFGASVGGEMGSAQSFDSNFRLASYSGILPALYRFAY